MQFSVNSIEKVKLQYIHLYNFLLNLYFNHFEDDDGYDLFVPIKLKENE